MAIDERARLRLHERLQAVLGPDEAAILMEHLPPVGWADVATKRDLDVLQAATKRDLDVLQAATKRDLDVLQAATKRDLDAFQGNLDALQGNLDAFQKATGLEHQLLKQEMMAAWRGDLLHQTRTTIFAMVSAVLAVGGLAFAAAHLT